MISGSMASTLLHLGQCKMQFQAHLSQWMLELNLCLSSLSQYCSSTHPLKISEYCTPRALLTANTNHHLMNKQLDSPISTNLTVDLSLWMQEVLIRSSNSRLNLNVVSSYRIQSKHQFTDLKQVKPLAPTKTGLSSSLRRVSTRLIISLGKSRWRQTLKICRAHGSRLSSV